jgi:hypothetical protein
MLVLGADAVTAAFADVSCAVPLLVVVVLLLAPFCPLLKRDANFSPLRSLLLLVLVLEGLGDEAGTSTVAEGEAAGGKPAGKGGIPPLPKGLHAASAPMDVSHAQGCCTLHNSKACCNLSVPVCTLATCHGSHHLLHGLQCREHANHTLHVLTGCLAMRRSPHCSAAYHLCHHLLWRLGVAHELSNLRQVHHHQPLHYVLDQGILSRQPAAGGTPC